MTSRRGFLGVLAGAVAAASFDPERALWVPGAKTISIPKPAFPPLECYTVVYHRECWEVRTPSFHPDIWLLQREYNRLFNLQAERIFRSA